MSMADPLPPGVGHAATVALSQQHDRKLGAPGIPGYSSSGHFDISQHLNGRINGYNNSASIDSSQIGAPGVPQPLSSCAVHPGATGVVVKPPPASQALGNATVTAIVDATGRSLTPSPTAAPPDQHQQPTANLGDAAAVAVKQEPRSPAAADAATPIVADFVKVELPPLVKEELSPLVKVELPPLSPLPRPDPAEPAEFHAEYDNYMQRWQSGDTLAQRWHRMKENGKWDEIREDWDEWQQDLMLLQLQQQIAATNKGKKRAKDDSEPDLDGPRQTRNRRAPATLQDYQVEAAVPSGPVSREVTPVLATKPRLGGTGRTDGGSEDGSYSDTEQDHMQRQRGTQQQQRRPGAAGGPGSRGAYRPPPPVIQQRPPQPRAPMHHPGQQVHQRWARYPQPQQTHQPTSMPGHGVDIQHQLYQVGTLMGQALHQAGGPAGSQAVNMAAALEHFARLYGNDPLFAQQMAAVHQQQAHH